MRCACVFLLLPLLALAGGCAGLPVERRPPGGAEAAQRPPAERGAAELPNGEPPDGAPAAQSVAPAGPPPVRGNPAVVALLDAAGSKTRAGRPEEAAAALERALRIEPANAGLWTRLAEVRLEQGRPREAEPLALKALDLGAAGDPALAARCHRLIASARRSLGDEEGARAAEARARAALDR